MCETDAVVWSFNMAEKKSQIGRRKRIVSRTRKVADAYVSKQDTAPKLTPIPKMIGQLRIDLEEEEQSWDKPAKAAGQERSKRGQKTVDNVLDVAVQLALAGTARHEWSSKIRQRTNVSQRHVQKILKKHWNVLQHRIQQHHSPR